MKWKILRLGRCLYFHSRSGFKVWSILLPVRLCKSTHFANTKFPQKQVKKWNFYREKKFVKLCQETSNNARIVLTKFLYQIFKSVAFHFQHPVFCRWSKKSRPFFYSDIQGRRAFKSSIDTRSARSVSIQPSCESHQKWWTIFKHKSEYIAILLYFANKS